MFDIATYIESESASRAVAERFTDRLTDYCEQIAKLPSLIGRARPEYGHNYRSVTYGSYVIFFRYTDEDGLRSHLYVIEKDSREEGAERNTKYIFIKSFLDKNKQINFMSVTIQREGKEIVISSYRRGLHALIKDIEGSRTLYVSGANAKTADSAPLERPTITDGPLYRRAPLQAGPFTGGPLYRRAPLQAGPFTGGPLDT